MKLERLFLLTLITILSCKTNDTFSLRKMNEKVRYQHIYENINSKNGAELGNFIYHIKESKINLKLYNQILIEKLENAKFPYDINILSQTLLENETNKSKIENILNSKINIWDKGNWSENFGVLIKKYNLNIEKPKYYELDSNSIKNYDVSEFIKTQINNDIIGENPLLIVDWNIINYEEGKLIETLNKLDIKQMDYTSKNNAVNLYGKRGIDGLLNVTTN